MRVTVNPEVLCRKCRKMVENHQEEKADEILRELVGRGIDLIPVMETLNITLPILRNHDLHLDKIEKRRRLAFFLRDNGLSYAKIGLILDRDHSAILRLLKK